MDFMVSRIRVGSAKQLLQPLQHNIYGTALLANGSESSMVPNISNECWDKSISLEIAKKHIRFFAGNAFSGKYEPKQSQVKFQNCATNYCTRKQYTLIGLI